MGALVLAGCTDTQPTQVPPTPAALGPCRTILSLRPQADLPAIRAEIEGQHIPDLIEIGDGAGTIGVGLRARAECVARQIVAAYGSKVEVSVGLLPFPPRPTAIRGCRNGDWPFAKIPFLSTALDIQPAQIPQGEFFKGTVRFKNNGLALSSLDTSSYFTAYLFAAGVDVPLGTSEGGSLGTGLEFTLAPGQSRDVPVFGGTASCDPALGYVLPIGHYEARATIDFSPPDGSGVHVFWSDPLPVEVVAASTP